MEFFEAVGPALVVGVECAGGESAACGPHSPLAGAGSPANLRALSPKTMADAANKYPENVTGKFYVDEQCIDCDLCRETAPANFKRNDDGGFSFLYKQPGSPEEEAQCKEAKEGCPVEAIGDDGS